MFEVPAIRGFETTSKKSAAHRGEAMLISVIIPALNESATICRSLSRLKDVASLEIIVVDGGSRDNTAALAGTFGAKVVKTAPGKAVQMNAGAAAATGGILVFLHADSVLPGDFNYQIVSALNQKDVAAGAFRLGIDSTRAGIQIIESMTNWRSRYLQLPYGDQALFMRKALFEEIGGFPEIPIMEDFILVRRLKRRGKIAIVAEPVITSARRWQHLGIFKTWLINQLIVMAYYLGISPDRLSRWYRREAGKIDT
jgi:rSAM/selenodomain-associated transferase 2